MPGTPRASTAATARRAIARASSSGSTIAVPCSATTCRTWRTATLAPNVAATSAASVTASSESVEPSTATSTVRGSGNVADEALSTRTGASNPLATAWLTLPRKSAPRSERPCEPIATRSASAFVAVLAISAATL